MKKLIPVILAAAIMSLLVTPTSHADLKDKLKSFLGSEEEPVEGDDEPAGGESDVVLSEDDRIAGLKEALEQGVTFAIEALGAPDGFWADDLVQIPIPDDLELIAKTASKLGGERYVSEFHETLNRAAEQAVPAAAELFSGAIGDMTIEDAADILGGPDDAATRYFREHTQDELTELFLPIVENATNEAGVTQAYKKLKSKGGNMMSMLNSDDLDLDAYVTNKAMDGLFFYIAAEEKKIRENPLARGTDLLKAVFGM